MSNVPPAIRKARPTRRRGNSAQENVLVGLGAALLFFGVIAAAVLLGGLVFWLAWNYGVVPIVAAAGGSVGKIGFWTGVAGSLAVGVIKHIFSPAGPRVEVKK